MEKYEELELQVISFEVDDVLTRELGGTGTGSWINPRGGYFVSFEANEGCAKEIIDKAKKAGVKMTPAGSTWPYHNDPHDSNIRVAPTYPPLEDLKTAAKLFSVCVKLVSAQKLYEAAKEQ